jgi:hypothetical protein
MMVPEQQHICSALPTTAYAVHNCHQRTQPPPSPATTMRMHAAHSPPPEDMKNLMCLSGAPSDGPRTRPAPAAALPEAAAAATPSLMPAAASRSPEPAWSLGSVWNTRRMRLGVPVRTPAAGLAGLEECRGLGLDSSCKEAWYRGLECQAGSIGAGIDAALQYVSGHLLACRVCVCMLGVRADGGTSH